MEKSESIKDLAAALCKFQGEVEKIKKEAKNPFFNSKYATLANILDVIRQPLANNGLSFVQMPQGENSLVTIIMHVSGEWISGEYCMRPEKNTPQGMGSCITYQRRYALASVLGLNIDDDDDGNAASGNTKSKLASAQPATPKKKRLFVRTDDHLVACCVDLIRGTNNNGANKNNLKWTLRDFENAFDGFTNEDLAFLNNLAQIAEQNENQ